MHEVYCSLTHSLVSRLSNTTCRDIFFSRFSRTRNNHGCLLVSFQLLQVFIFFFKSLASELSYVIRQKVHQKGKYNFQLFMSSPTTHSKICCSYAYFKSFDRKDRNRKKSMKIGNEAVQMLPKIQDVFPLCTKYITQNCIVNSHGIFCTFPKTQRNHIKSLNEKWTNEIMMIWVKVQRCQFRGAVLLHINIISCTT